ncbi:MAG: hypothetical protein KIS87_08855 [Phycisphaeraceae bacterium]|nr:hypothetical protein [Phycisphaeraceae bacterium]
MGREAPATDIGPPDDQAVASEIESGMDNLGADDPSADDRAARRAAAAKLREFEPVSNDLGVEPDPSADDVLLEEGEDAAVEVEDSTPAVPERRGPQPGETAQLSDRERAIARAYGIDDTALTGAVTRHGLDAVRRELTSLDHTIYSDLEIIARGGAAAPPASFPDGAGPSAPSGGFGPPSAPVPASGPQHAPSAGAGAPSGGQATGVQPYTDDELRFLRENLGDEVVDRVLVPERNARVEQQRRQQELERELGFLRGDRMASVEADNERFFRQVAGEGFDDVYGRDRATATEAQIRNRQMVAMAARSLAGAYAAAGRPITLEQARERAHLALTADRQRATARREVEAAVERRGRQVSVPPSPRGGGTGPNGKPMSTMQRINAAHRKLYEGWGMRPPAGV